MGNSRGNRPLTDGYKPLDVVRVSIDVGAIRTKQREAAEELSLHIDDEGGFGNYGLGVFATAELA